MWHSSPGQIECLLFANVSRSPLEYVTTFCQIECLLFANVSRSPLSDRVIPSRYILLSLDTRCDTTLVTLYSLSDRVIRWKRIVSRSPFTQPSGSISISSYRRTLDVTPLLWHSTRCQIEWSAAKRIVSRSRSGQKKIAPKSDLIQYKVNDRLS